MPNTAMNPTRQCGSSLAHNGTSVAETSIGLAYNEPSSNAAMFFWSRAYDFVPTSVGGVQVRFSSAWLRMGWSIR